MLLRHYYPLSLVPSTKFSRLVDQNTRRHVCFKCCDKKKVGNFKIVFFHKSNCHIYTVRELIWYVTEYWNKSTTIFVNSAIISLFAHVCLLLFFFCCTCSFALIVANNNETNTRWDFCESVDWAVTCADIPELFRILSIIVWASPSVISVWQDLHLFLPTLPPVG